MCWAKSDGVHELQEAGNEGGTPLEGGGKGGTPLEANPTRGQQDRRSAIGQQDWRQATGGLSRRSVEPQSAAAQELRTAAAKDQRNAAALELVAATAQAEWIVGLRLSGLL